MTLDLTFYNSLTRKDEVFVPEDSRNVRMYVCGPTVYARAHLGNARSVVVYDVLYRLLRHVFGAEHVTYARNITDVDDKINAAAIENKESIQALTQRVTGWFHDDMDALNCLRPTVEPRATEHIAEMRTMIEDLVAHGHAYVADNHVLFDVMSDADYGKLSGRKTEDQEAGARIAVESYKKHAGDFVLWKPADSDDDASSVFDGPFGIKGRPGWHIECSAMSTKHLGVNFDLHGGGADLMFPHHENEIAQSCCANQGSHFAKTWVHNGFLTVNGEKMSKSLGNFLTVHDVLDGGVQGEVIRLALLSSHYRKPLDWNDKLVDDAKKILDGWYRKIALADGGGHDADVIRRFEEALADDLNLPKAMSVMHEASAVDLQWMGNVLGVLQCDAEDWFKGAGDNSEVDALVQARIVAKKAKNWTEADRIRNVLKEQGIVLEDKPDGTTDWRKD